MRHSSAFRTQLLGPLGISLMLSFVHKRLPAHEYRIQIVIKHVLFSAAYRSYLKLKAVRLFANRCRKNQALTIHHLYICMTFFYTYVYLLCNVPYMYLYILSTSTCYTMSGTCMYCFVHTCTLFIVCRYIFATCKCTVHLH